MRPSTSEKIKETRAKYCYYKNHLAYSTYILMGQQGGIVKIIIFGGGGGSGTVP